MVEARLNETLLCWLVLNGTPTPLCIGSLRFGRKELR